MVFHLPFTPSSVPPTWWAMLQLPPLTAPCLFLELRAHPASSGRLIPPASQAARRPPWKPLRHLGGPTKCPPSSAGVACTCWGFEVPQGGLPRPPSISFCLTYCACGLLSAGFRIIAPLPSAVCSWWVRWILSEASPLLCGCHCPVRDVVCPIIVEVETPRSDS